MFDRGGSTRLWSIRHNMAGAGREGLQRRTQRGPSGSARSFRSPCPAGSPREPPPQHTHSEPPLRGRQPHDPHTLSAVYMSSSTSGYTRKGGRKERLDLRSKRYRGQKVMVVGVKCGDTNRGDTIVPNRVRVCMCTWGGCSQGLGRNRNTARQETRGARHEAQGCCTAQPRKCTLGKVQKLRNIAQRVSHPPVVHECELSVGRHKLKHSLGVKALCVHPFVDAVRVQHHSVCGRARCRDARRK